MKNWLLTMVLLLGLAGHAWAQQARQLTGQVLDEASGQGLPGVTVVVKGTTIGTGTDGSGNFSLNLPAGTEPTLVLSYVGYLAQTVTVDNSNTIKVRLKTDQKALDEVVVIGYGEVKKSDVTGAIVSVKEADLKKIPAANVMETLQGRLPGVDITSASGSAGAAVNIAVRGNRSILASNGPLFIVDGVQYNSIQDINPNDIQSMEVLKDAASTAIYGARGANGVIIVTTKKGAAGKTTITLNSYYGVTDKVYYPKVNNGAEYVAQKREANRTTGNWSSPADDSKIFTPLELQAIASGTTTNWADLLLRNGVQQEHQIGVAGGSEKTKFYLSGDYYNEQGLFRNDKLNRYSFRANIDQAINDKVRIGLQNQLTYYNLDARRDPTNLANKINPLFTPYDANGNFVNYPNNAAFLNPLADEQTDAYSNNTRRTRTFSTAYVSYQILPSLNFRSNVGLTLSNDRTGIYQGQYSIDRNGQVNQASYGTGFETNWSWENILNYSKTFGDHSISATGVTSLLTFNQENSLAQGRGIPVPYQQYYALANAAQVVTPYTNLTRSKLISLTGRVQYGFKSRYLLTLTAREDGSSKLYQGNNFAFFPSAAVAWRIVDEEFMKGVTPVTDLKLRVSYGKAGNYDVAPYSSQSLLTRIPFSFGETSAAGYGFDKRVGNTDLDWEISWTKNVGLDFGLIRNRLTGSIDVYETMTSDLLLDNFLPSTTGRGNITENIGKTRNRGVEVGLNALAYETPDFRWNVGVTWFKNQERILELGGADDLVNNRFVGYPVRVFYDYEKIGIWQTDEADAAKAVGQKPGQIKVKDLNGDGKITAAADRRVLGSAVPKWSGSFNSDFSYKGIDLSFQIFARIGQMINYEYAQIFDPQGIENSGVHNYWTPENPSNDYPRPDASLSKSTMQNSLYGTTLQYRDGSFAKLRGVTLGYNLPKGWLEKVGVGTARIYVQGKNLYTVSKIDNYDPERGGPITTPIPRVVLAGINLGF
ncbi:SusC/RagA family TonB-linked outer membrane protein [Hymenobacter chitinivorans]|uniref:TonB-linked SusC/RagA family outer membrane protein n=1 Tax=Hymenobacter chitinivorans DSM 11115 TaxID=1121954 RepID=A0A2M9AQW1_9BACT|nr:TonB-dependent receptor [Hymenobacter chitinivorans]PJJ48096.1 TonB-linked SusC/RagA family outer membrane protein [Hymenobacter chitinivorans DSM 11115]